MLSDLSWRMRRVKDYLLCTFLPVTPSRSTTITAPSQGQETRQQKLSQVIRVWSPPKSTVPHSSNVLRAGTVNAEQISCFLTLVVEIMQMLRFKPPVKFDLLLPVDRQSTFPMPTLSDRLVNIARPKFLAGTKAPIYANLREIAQLV